MGRGAEVSVMKPLLVSICSGVETSMGWSIELLRESRAGVSVSGGPRGQQSPPANFTGLWNHRRSDKCDWLENVVKVVSVSFVDIIKPAPQFWYRFH